MRDVGQMVNMNYSCGASGAYTDSLPLSFYNLGYNATRTTNFRHTLILQNLDWSRPVILTGHGNGDHCWVCDGYNQITYVYTDENGACLSIGYLFLHMNWGWGGHSDAWFSFNNFNPGPYNFNNCKEIFYNITPR